MAKNYSNKENNRNMANNNASENGYSSYADEQNRNSKNSRNANKTTSKNCHQSGTHVSEKRGYDFSVQTAAESYPLLYYTCEL